jgi:hypothetical protein
MKLLRWGLGGGCRCRAVFRGPFTLAWALLLSSSVFGLGCSRSRKFEGDEPPPRIEIVATANCASDAQKTLPELPARAAGYCLLGGSDVVRYGGKAGGSLGAVCSELFNGECELYRSYGLAAVTVARYGDEKRSGRFVNAVLTEFDRASGAFGFFQLRALGDSHPESATVSPLLLPLGQGRALLGAGVLYVWRGRQVAEFTYLSEDQTPDELRAQSFEILPSFAAQTAASLGGLGRVPFEAEFLEAEQVFPVGVRLLADHWLEIPGTGPGAEAYVQGPSGRHRAVLAVRSDEASARDLLRMVRYAMGAPPSKKKDAVLKARRQRAGHEPESWLFVREGRAVVGVGPDELKPQDLTPQAAEAALAALVARLRRTPPPPQ